jgi:adenosylcobinamide-phosphate synthase
MTATVRKIVAQPLTAAAFAPFGQVIDTAQASSRPMNAGMARRFHDLAEIEVIGDGARVVVGLVEAQPYAMPLWLNLVERHPLGAQAFVPLNAAPFLVVVCPDEAGKPGTPQAFVTAPHQGIWTGAVSAGLWAALESALPPLAAAVVGGIFASSLLAQRSLAEHAEAVADRLEADGLDGGREAVTFLVGRDVSALDEAGVCRATVESLAENFSDGVVAPLFWLAVGGLPGAALYKATNTADSMIGHKSERYLAFGWASARLDDLLNLPGSRLAALWLTLAALLQPSASAVDAARAVFRDARRHRSPNAGWPEAAMAGALGFKLGGPRIYGGTPVDDAWMGDGRTALTADDIRAALRLYRTACLIQANALAATVVAFTAL